MKNVCKGLLLAVLLSLMLPAGYAAGESATGLAVTYLGNEGFLVSSAGKSVLIDALFDDGLGQYAVPSPTLVARMNEGSGPFGRVDALLVTHNHPDHFSAPRVAEFVKRHKETTVVASQAVCALLQAADAAASRCRPIALNLGDQGTVAAGGVSVRALRVRHSGDPGGTRVESLAYLVTLDGRKVLHVGDGMIDGNVPLYERLRADGGAIDVVFLPYWDYSDATARLLKDVVKPKHVAAMHVPTAGGEADVAKFRAVFPNAVVFEKALEARNF